MYSLIFVCGLWSAIFGGGDGATYTLYRNSVPDVLMRIHVSTFDAADGEEYNQENCEIAASLFREQPGVSVRYWCEKGSYRR